MPSPEFSPSLSSVESLRLSIPESYQSLFDTLRKEVIDFCHLHNIPTFSLNNDGALREATKHLSLADLEHLSLVLKRLEYLIEHKKPIPGKESLPEHLKEIERLYNLEAQYTSQVSLLEQVGILKDGHIEAIDGKRYPVPTLEQIAQRLYERRTELSLKRNQGFTKLLLVPFGMSLNILCETLKQFLLNYEKKHPDFELDTDDPLWIREGYQGVDQGPSPDLVYDPTSFDKVNHQGKTKAQILKEQSRTLSSFPGWTVHLFQPSNPEDPSSPGIAPIPREGKGKIYGQDTDDPLDLSTLSRPDIEANKTPTDYLSLLHTSQDNPDSPYLHETGLTPEDWILAFMTHLQETGKPLDDVFNPSNQGSCCFLTRAFFPSFVLVPRAYWFYDDRHVIFGGDDPDSQYRNEGSRSSVIV